MSASEPKAGPSATPELALNSGVNKKAERIRARALAQPKPKVKTLPKAKPEPIPYRATSHPDEDEQAAVHEVYERIAPHFSQTRHKPWPLISTFLHSLPPNSIGLDSGGGNGKYVPTAREAGVGMVVMDRSLGLLNVARTQPGFGGSKGKAKAEDGSQEPDGCEAGAGECVRGDLTYEGWRENIFDFAISIAAIHHLSTPARRRRAVQALVQPLVHSLKSPYARFMIYVWAYEQSSGSKRRMGATADSSTSTPLEGSKDGSPPERRVQDVLVPWVLQPPKQSPGPVKEGQQNGGGDQKQDTPPEVLHRYYHLFVEGELRELVVSAATEGGYHILPDGGSGSSEAVDSGQLGIDQKWMRIRGVGWEADNWWIEGEVGRGKLEAGM